MGYCCGHIEGSQNLITSKDLTCLKQGTQFVLTVETTATRIIWFFKGVNDAIFTQITAAENQKEVIFTQIGEYKVIVQGDNGSAIVKGSIPCPIKKKVDIVLPPNPTGNPIPIIATDVILDTDKIMFARENAAGEIVSYHTYQNRKYRNLTRGMPLTTIQPLDGIGINDENGQRWIGKPLPNGDIATQKLL